MTDLEPVAVPQATPQVPAAQPIPQRQAGTNSLPPQHTQQTVSDDTALAMFHKISAERRERQGDAPLEVPFGSGTIRIHRTMPAGFAFDAQAAEVDPHAAKRALRDAIHPVDHERFDAILKLPPDNPEGVDGLFLLGFLEALAELYTGVPLGVRSH